MNEYSTMCSKYYFFVSLLVDKTLLYDAQPHISINWTFLHFFFVTVAHLGDFAGGPVAMTLCSQCRGPGFNPWPGTKISHAATKNLHATAKTEDPMCCN